MRQKIVFNQETEVTLDEGFKKFMNNAVTVNLHIKSIDQAEAIKTIKGYDAGKKLQG